MAARKAGAMRDAAASPSPRRRGGKHAARQHQMAALREHAFEWRKGETDQRRLPGAAGGRDRQGGGDETCDANRLREHEATGARHQNDGADRQQKEDEDDRLPGRGRAEDGKKGRHQAQNGKRADEAPQNESLVAQTLGRTGHDIGMNEGANAPFEYQCETQTPNSTPHTAA